MQFAKNTARACKIRCNIALWIAIPEGTFSFHDMNESLDGSVERGSLTDSEATDIVRSVREHYGWTWNARTGQWD